jgi:Ca2+-binding EF-hand superfamily protein
VSIESFRRALQRCGVRVELEDVGRLADVCDAHGDGKIDYRSILDQVSSLYL